MRGSQGVTLGVRRCGRDLLSIYAQSHRKTVEAYLEIGETAPEDIETYVVQGLLDLSEAARS